MDGMYIVGTSIKVTGVRKNLGKTIGTISPSISFNGNDLRNTQLK